MCDCNDADCEFPARFPDGKSLDEAAAEALLRPYPELWRQWQVQVYGPWEEGYGPGSGGLRRLHSPTYLRAVVREYEWLREGGDRPDPALAARCEAIVAARPEIAEERRQALEDPWGRAQSPEMLGYMPETVAHYYDPDYLQHKVDYAKRHDDPFDPVAIRSHLFGVRMDALGSRNGAAPNN